MSLITPLKRNSSKSRILVALKHRGGASVDELAAEVELAPMTVRQHLTALERDGLISGQEVRRATGRPHVVYRLTPVGEETFPRRYEALAGMLLDAVALVEGGEMAFLSPEAKTALLLDKVADRFVERHAARFAGKELPERVRILADLMQEESGFAEWARTEKGFELRDYNCAYRQLAEQNQQVCVWHVNVLSRLLGTPVDHAHSLCYGSECCTFAVPVFDQRPAPGGPAHG